MNRSRTAVFFIAYMLFFFSFWMVLAYLPLVLKSYQFTDKQIGFAIGLNSLASLILVLPFGVFSDYFSPKRALILGTIFYSVYLSLLIVLRDFYTLCLALLLGGVGAASMRVILMSLYLKLTGHENRGKKVAFIHMGAYLGFALGPLVGGLCYESYGPQAMIKLAFCLSMAIVVSCFFVKDAPPGGLQFQRLQR